MVSNCVVWLRRLVAMRVWFSIRVAQWSVWLIRLSLFGSGKFSCWRPDRWVVGWIEGARRVVSHNQVAGFSRAGQGMPERVDLGVGGWERRIALTWTFFGLTTVGDNELIARRTQAD